MQAGGQKKLLSGETEMLIYILRHGETDYNITGRLQGWADIPLNAKGVALAAQTGEGLKGTHFDVCFSSPLIRAVETARQVLGHSGNMDTPIQTDDRLKEIHMGRFEGLGCKSDHYELPPESDFPNFFKDGFSFSGFPGGETVKQVCRRSADFLEEIIQNPQLQDKTVLISGHGCSSRALLNYFYEDKDNFWRGHVPYNCSINIVRVDTENGEKKSQILEEDKIFYDRNQIVDVYRK